MSKRETIVLSGVLIATSTNKSINSLSSTDLEDLLAIRPL